MEHRLIRAFGKVEGVDLADVPAKVGNILISRILNHDKVGTCAHCFPHGRETCNSKIGKNRKSWKNNRRAQYRDC